MKFQLLMKAKYLKHLDFVFILLINVKMPTIICILTFMSRFFFVEHEYFYNSQPFLITKKLKVKQIQMATRWGVQNVMLGLNPDHIASSGCSGLIFDQPSVSILRCKYGTLDIEMTTLKKRQKIGFQDQLLL